MYLASTIIVPACCNLFDRHHTNPVGTEWRWQMDDAELVLKGALEGHVNMIKQFKGITGIAETPSVHKLDVLWH